MQLPYDHDHDGPQYIYENGKNDEYVIQKSTKRPAFFYVCLVYTLLKVALITIKQANKQTNKQTYFTI
jgi:hypothetical protein